MQSVSNISGFGLAEELLREGREVTMRVMGQSMIPFLKSSEQITLRPFRSEDLRVGVIVMAKVEQKRYVVHRIYRISSEHITLLGDGNLNPEYVKRSDICGVVDSSHFEQRVARLWQWMRPLRRYPLAIMRRILPK